MRFAEFVIISVLLCGGGLYATDTSPRAQRSSPQVSNSLQDAQKILRLKTLIEAAEKALTQENENAAQERVDEIETLISNWQIELLTQEDVEELLERLEKIRRTLGYEPNDSEVDDTEDAPELSEEGLRAERERVEAAEADVIYDFPVDLNGAVLKEIALLLGRDKENVQAAFTRGTRYFPMIHRILAEEGVPLDLAFLPFVESRYKLRALSKARAMGMWQFIPSTGRIYGLRQDSWVDERRDPEKATRAAARFLKKLYTDYDDWYLSLAGYNGGPGRVGDALQGTGSRNFWDHARSRYLRKETKDYVPKMCAAVLVGKHPERYGLEVTQLEPYEYDTVEVNKSISLGALARITGLDSETLKDLNPELIRSTTPPRLYTLKVPLGTTGRVAEALASLPVAERLEFRNYKIVQGDTLAKVAARYKTTPEDLLDFNNMPRSRFRVGRTIVVPVAASATATKPAPRK